MNLIDINDQVKEIKFPFQDRIKFWRSLELTDDYDFPGGQSSSSLSSSVDVDSNTDSPTDNDNDSNTDSPQNSDSDHSNSI